MRLTTIMVFLTLLYTSCVTETRDKLRFTSSPVDTSKTARQISLRDLRQDYKSLQGQQVETEGIVWFQFENVSICPTIDALSEEERKCFWLDFHNDLNLNDSLMQLASGSRFIIKGTIDTTRAGHFGMYLGTIKDIYFMQQK
jgi:hypothetical protein